jgi:hypothetical protein
MENIKMDFSRIKYRRPLSKLKHLSKQLDSAQKLTETCIAEAEKNNFLTLQLFLKYEKLYSKFIQGIANDCKLISKLIVSLPMPYALEVLLHPQMAQHMLSHPEAAQYLCEIVCTHKEIGYALLNPYNTFYPYEIRTSIRLLEKMRKAILFHEKAPQYVCDIMVKYKSIAIQLFQCRRTLEEEMVKIILQDLDMYKYLDTIAKTYHLEPYIQRADNIPLPQEESEICNLFLRALLASEISGNPHLDDHFQSETEAPWHPLAYLN